jgi:hypothetical protein
MIDHDEFKAACRGARHGHAIAILAALDKDATMDARLRKRIELVARQAQAAGYEDVAAWIRRKLREAEEAEEAHSNTVE